MADFGFIWSGGIPHALSSSCYRWRFTWRRHIPCAISYVIQYIPEISIDGPPRAEWWSMEYILARLRNISLTHSPLDKILLELVQNDSPMENVHYGDVIMDTIASQITSLTIVYSTVYSDADDQRKHQSSASLAFVWGIHRGPVNSPHKWKMFPFDDVIICYFGSGYC